MKVLITGASGRLGGYLIRELVGDHDLVLMSRTQPADEFADIPWIAGDLTNFADCQRAVEGAQVIQHLGAQPWPVDHPQMQDQAEKQGLPFDATFKSNMLGTYYLMQAAIGAGVDTVVMAGSNCALGHGFRISQTPFPLHYFPIDEHHPCYPEDSYSYSKRAGEELLAGFSRAYNIRTYVTRISGICPPDRRQQMAQSAQPVTGWSPWMWCWVGSEDVAHAHRLLIDAANDLPLHDVFYLNADDTTALEPSQELVERFNPDVGPQAKELVDHQTFFSNAKLKKAIGWEHKTSWRTFLKG